MVLSCVGLVCGVCDHGKHTVARLLGVSKAVHAIAAQVLSNVYFQAYPNELHMILGPNGSGKVSMKCTVVPLRWIKGYNVVCK